eukprot:COSAG04_NODE_18436_length_441_cov_1.812865_1_plen_20_part_10
MSTAEAANPVAAVPAEMEAT